MKGKYSGIVLSILFLVGAICIADLHGAKKYTAKGKSVNTPYSQEDEKLPDGRILRHGRQRGFILADDEDYPLHMASIDCSGISLWQSDGSRWQGSGTCVEIDRDGDIAWCWWEGTNEGVKWGYLRGTGKYEGATGSGTATLDIHNFPNGKWIEEWEGTLELK